VSQNQPSASSEPTPKNSLDELRGMTTRDALAYWLALPTKTRNPATQKELASLLNVSEERLCQIKRDKKFQEQVQEYRKTFFKQFTSDIIDALKVSATKGNDRSAKLFLQVVEDFQETSKQKIEKTEVKRFVFQLPPKKLDELRQKIRQLKKNPEGVYTETNEEIPFAAKSG
jgi:hypothetical protein